MTFLSTIRLTCTPGPTLETLPSLTLLTPKGHRNVKSMDNILTCFESKPAKYVEIIKMVIGVFVAPAAKPPRCRRSKRRKVPGHCTKRCSDIFIFFVLTKNFIFRLFRGPVSLLWNWFYYSGSVTGTGWIESQFFTNPECKQKDFRDKMVNKIPPKTTLAIQTMLIEGGSPGLVVLGDDSCLKGCGFESLRCDGYQNSVRSCTMFGNLFNKI